MMINMQKQVILDIYHWSIKGINHMKEFLKYIFKLL